MGGDLNLGHSEQLTVKMHPDLAQHLRLMAGRRYISVPEYMRQLIVADMIAKGDE